MATCYDAEAYSSDDVLFFIKFPHADSSSMAATPVARYLAVVLCMMSSLASASLAKATHLTRRRDNACKGFCSTFRAVDVLSG